jgi:kinesin family member 5
MYEKKIAELVKQSQDEHARFEGAEQQLDLAKRLLSDHQNSIQVTLYL